MPARVSRGVSDTRGVLTRIDEGLLARHSRGRGEDKRVAAGRVGYAQAAGAGAEQAAGEGVERGAQAEGGDVEAQQEEAAQRQRHPRLPRRHLPSRAPAPPQCQLTA